jgi:iron complex transport system substrate-binding protein
MNRVGKRRMNRVVRGVMIGLWGVMAMTVSGAEAAGGRVSVRDMGGRQVEVPKVVRRVVTDRFTSLMIFALDENLAANATFRVSEAGKPYISAKYYTHRPLMETAEEETMRLRPDVIVVGLVNAASAEKADRLQRRTGIPVLVVDFRVAKAREAFAFLGDALGRQAAAHELTEFIERYIEPIGRLRQRDSSSAGKGKAPRVYYAEGTLGLETEPAGSLHGQVLDYVHADNVAKVGAGDVHGMSRASMEQVLAWDPEVIVVWSGFPAGHGLPQSQRTAASTATHILKDKAWQGVAAVRAGRVYQTPGKPFGWIDRPPSSNCLAGVIWLAEKLYPDRLPYNAEEALKEYARLFYHSPGGRFTLD